MGSTRIFLFSPFMSFSPWRKLSRDNKFVLNQKFVFCVYTALPFPLLFLSSHSTLKLRKNTGFFFPYYYYYFFFSETVVSEEYINFFLWPSISSDTVAHFFMLFWDWQVSLRIISTTSVKIFNAVPNPCICSSVILYSWALLSNGRALFCNLWKKAYMKLLHTPIL